MEKIIRNVNWGYGEYGCSKCNAALVKMYNYVGKQSDEDGYEWRGFCNDCWQEIQKMSNEEIYSKYPTGKYLHA
jgi:uncharacterized protein with PIN domain